MLCSNRGSHSSAVDLVQVGSTGWGYHSRQRVSLPQFRLDPCENVDESLMAIPSKTIGQNEAVHLVVGCAPTEVSNRNQAGAVGYDSLNQLVERIPTKCACMC